MPVDPHTTPHLTAPDIGEFHQFRTPAGRTWNLRATPLAPGGENTNDQGCVAVAHHPDGWVMIADTKRDLDAQVPLVFLPAEWRDFTAAIREGQI